MKKFKFFILLVAFSTRWAHGQDVGVSILNYDKSALFFKGSNVDQLYINVTSRMQTQSEGENNEYYLLAPHPREYVWGERPTAYEDMLRDTGAASMITFIIDKYGNSIASRRFGDARDSQVQHYCSASPFGFYSKPPEKFDEKRLIEVKDDKGLRVSSETLDKLYVVLNYEKDGRLIKIDYPIELVNFNPNRGARKGERWQAISSIVPLYVGGNNCQGVRQGYVAIRSFDGPAEFIYLCNDQNDGPSVNDFKCVLKTEAKARIFKIRKGS